jgi:hypothetical protein
LPVVVGAPGGVDFVPDEPHLATPTMASVTADSDEDSPDELVASLPAEPEP